MSLVDLHTHSCYSDGSDTPKELVDKALSLGLHAIALTDHNTTAGLDEFISYTDDKPIEAVPGCEFSVDYNGTELHILGLFIEPVHFPKVDSLLEEYNLRKEASNRNLVKALNCKGYHLDYDKIASRTPNGHINRAHIASELVDLGYGTSVRELINTLLSPEQGLYVPPKRHSAFEIIHFIHSIGAVSVLAHPFLNLDESSLRRFLTDCKDLHLDGMETSYSLYDETTAALARSIADEFGLLHSGGSDYHGKTKPDTNLGTGRGNVTVTVQNFNLLKQLSSQTKHI